MNIRRRKVLYEFMDHSAWDMSLLLADTELRSPFGLCLGDVGRVRERSASRGVTSTWWHPLDKRQL